MWFKRHYDVSLVFDRPGFIRFWTGQILALWCELVQTTPTFSPSTNFRLIQYKPRIFSPTNVANDPSGLRPTHAYAGPGFKDGFGILIGISPLLRPATPSTTTTGIVSIAIATRLARFRREQREDRHDHD